MEYGSFVRNVKNLDFISDDEQADAAVKAVFGVMASNMSEEDAERLGQELPGPLEKEKLRSHQEYDMKLGKENFKGVIANQFNIEEDQADTLITQVLHTAKDEVSNERVNAWKNQLPEGWGTIIERA